jgi:hypothetical protein
VDKTLQEVRHISVGVLDPPVASHQSVQTYQQAYGGTPAQSSPSPLLEGEAIVMPNANDSASSGGNTSASRFSPLGHIATRRFASTSAPTIGYRGDSPSVRSCSHLRPINICTAVRRRSLCPDRRDAAIAPAPRAHARAAQAGAPREDSINRHDPLLPGYRGNAAAASTSRFEGRAARDASVLGNITNPLQPVYQRD